MTETDTLHPNKNLSAVPLMSSEISAHLLSLVHQFIFPLYSFRSGRIAHLGTAFVVQNEGVRFLVSAAHVLQQHKDGAIGYYVGQTETTIIGGDLFANSDHFGDVGLVPLGPDIKLPVDRIPIPATAFKPPVDRLKGGLLFICGFPSSRNKPNWYLKRIEPVSIAILTHPIELSEYTALGFDAKRHFLAHLEEEGEVIGGGGNVATIPALNGLSGSPVLWLQHMEDVPSLSSIRFVGLVAFKVPHKNLLVSTSAGDLAYLLQVSTMQYKAIKARHG